LENRLPTTCGNTCSKAITSKPPSKNGLRAGSSSFGTDEPLSVLRLAAGIRGAPGWGIPTQPGCESHVDPTSNFINEARFNLFHRDTPWNITSGKTLKSYGMNFVEGAVTDGDDANPVGPRIFITGRVSGGSWDAVGHDHTIGGSDTVMWIKAGTTSSWVPSSCGVTTPKTEPAQAEDRSTITAISAATHGRLHDGLLVGLPETAEITQTKAQSTGTATRRIPGRSHRGLRSPMDCVTK